MTCNPECTRLHNDYRHFPPTIIDVLILRYQHCGIPQRREDWRD